MDFSTFLNKYKEKLSHLFSKNSASNERTLNRGFEGPEHDQIMELVPLKAFIPTQFGGFGGHTAEALAMLEASSYESLPLALMMGINGALFTQPVARFGDEVAKNKVLKSIAMDKKMGGLMITEPDFGSDALKMQTSSLIGKGDGHYHVHGTKHWAGLTGAADYWLITAREQDQNGDLGRDISFFIHETSNGGIEVEEYFNNLGLYMLPYGRNKIDIRVPQTHKLKPQSTGVTMMLDILHRSRLQFPGMGMGFLRRMMDEAIDHCKERFVGGQSLLNYDQVKHRISEMQAYFTVCSAMCHYTSSKISLDIDTSRMDVAANAIKTVVTDFMQKASQSLLQLTGAKGYRLDHIAGRSVVDSRPFQIFEGSNDILYQQISESVLKNMRKVRNFNLYDYLKASELTEQVSDRFKDSLDFDLDLKMPQRKLVALGQAIGRIISMEFTINLEDVGFNQALIANAMATMESEVNSIICNFKHAEDAAIVDDYLSNSSWLALSKVNAI
ncbi:MAG: acyl-CoA dehydrogenase family protein [Bacteroidota bacterium]